MPPRVLVVGSANMDLVVRCRRVPRAGETVLGADFRTVPGGKGANQAVACARLGARTTLVGRVGEDAFGRALLRGLAQEGVQTESVLVDPEAPSGVAVILLDEEGGNRIVVAGGANARLDATDVARVEELLADCDVVLMQLEIPLPVVQSVAATARGRGVRVVLDAGAAAAEAAQPGLLCLPDVLSPNEAEAEVLTGVEVHTIDDARAAARRLQEMGVRQVVLKLGRSGALWLGEGIDQHVPAFPIDAVDSTAAGDAFTGCLAVGLASGLPMEQALVRANAAGALACLSLGAQPSMPTLAQLDAFLTDR